MLLWAPGRIKWTIFVATVYFQLRFSYCLDYKIPLGNLHEFFRRRLSFCYGQFFLFLSHRFSIACEHALCNALAAGREKEGELPTTSLEFEFHLQFSRWLSCQISASQRECKQHWKARTKSNDVITNVISANQYSASTFPMQIFKVQRRSWKLSFLFPPRRQSAPETLLAG